MQHTPKYAAILIVSALTMLAGCATEQHARNEACPPNHTLVCKDHMGQDQECKCYSKATMRDVFDLRRNR